MTDLSFTWLRTSPEGTLVDITVLPNSSRTEIVGEYAKRLKIRIQQPALDGKANKALCRFLAEEFDQPRTSITVAAGEKTKLKTVLFAAADITFLEERLAYIKKVAP